MKALWYLCMLITVLTIADWANAQSSMMPGTPDAGERSTQPDSPPQPAQASTGVISISCQDDRPMSLPLLQALKQLRRGMILVIHGTCRLDQSLVVEQDGITIDGQGGILTSVDRADQSLIQKQQPVLIIDRAKQVTIKNLTVTRGYHGIVVKNGAQVKLLNVASRFNAGNGLVIGGGRLAPGPVPRQTILRQASVILPSGQAEICGNEGGYSNNGLNGIKVGSNVPTDDPARLDVLPNCQVMAVDNGKSGLKVINNSNATLHANARITATSNKEHGMVANNSSTIVFEVQNTATTNNNNNTGVRLANASGIHVEGNSNSVLNGSGNGLIGAWIANTALIQCDAPATLVRNIAINDPSRISGCK